MNGNLAVIDPSNAIEVTTQVYGVEKHPASTAVECRSSWKM